MVLKLHFFPQLLNTTVGAYDHGCAEDAYKLFAIPFLFTREAHPVDHGAIDIGEQGKVQLMLFSKFVV